MMEDALGDRVDRARLINLNILPVLRELLRLRNVSQAALALNMSQSAASDALSRLRATFDDPLLIQVGRGFALTEKAEALEPLVREALGELELLFDAAPFDPANAQGRIHIAASDDAALLLGPPLVRELTRSAPGLCVQFHDLDDGSLEELSDGLLDFALMPEAALSASDAPLETTYLFEDELVLLRHASDTEATSRPEAFAVVLAQPGSRRDWGVESGGGSEAERIGLSTCLLLPFFVESTSTSALAPRRMAKRFAQAAAFSFEPPPTPMPPIRTFLVSNPVRSNDPLHRWMTGQFVQVAASLEV